MQKVSLPGLSSGYEKYESTIAVCVLGLCGPVLVVEGTLQEWLL